MALAAALLLAPLAWAFDQAASYALVKWVCATGAKDALTGIAVIALCMTAAGGVCGGTMMLGLRGAAPDGGRRDDPRYFLAVVAVAFNAIIALLIITATMPRYVLSPCE
jgi:hypothetical protein